MNNFTKSDFALNKFSDGIVYNFANAVFEVTLEDYLAESPDHTEDGFRRWKEFSDGDYLEQAQAENAQTKKNTSLEELENTVLCAAPSMEELLINKIDAQEEAERREQQVELMNRAKDTLKDTQRRRYQMYCEDGLTLQKIAIKEKVTFQVIHKNILAAEKKILSFCEHPKNGVKNRGQKCIR